MTVAQTESTVGLVGNFSSHKPSKNWKQWHKDTPKGVHSDDANTPDAWIKRHPGLVRLTGKHPLNCEPELTTLMECGFNTPPALHYVRNHGAVPRIKWEEHRVVVNGLVDKEIVFTMEDIVKLPAITIPVTLVCAGNRRKEENMVKKTIGFSWGPAGVSTSDWTGVRLADVLKMAGVKPEGKHVCMRGPKKELPQGEDGSYATSVLIEYAADPANDILIAYRQNGELLTPDHGFPVRIIIPGFIGGRMIKYLEEVTVTAEESDNYYHFFDNRVLPSHVDQQLAAKEGWWYKPEFIINQLNINSAMAFPAHDECIPLDGSQKRYTLGGYAYTGNGAKIIRCEVTLDGGKSWRLANIRRFEKPTAAGKYWCWVFWDIEVDVAELAAAKSHEIACRAWDSCQNTQPDSITWNVMGMMNNCWFRVRLNPTVDSRGRLVLRAQHPTQPANRVGGWMGDNPVDPTAAQAAAPAKEEAKGLPVYTAEEVEKHSAEDDCWLIYKGEVYDVTSYIHEHPGGADSITMLAGTDCTDEFDSIHSKTAREIFAKYKIGRLGTAAEKSAAPAAKAAAPAGKGGDDAEGTVHVQREGGGPVRGLLRLLGGLGGRKEGSDREIEREGSEEAPSREVSVAEERVEEDLVVLQGRGKVDLPLVHREDLNHNTRLYRFGLPSAAHRLGLPVGKHVFLSAMIDGKLVMRAYTPKTNDLVRGHVDFVIKTYFAGQHPKFPEGGKMTQHLEKLSIGDTVSFRGPLGEFEYLGRGEYVHKGVRGRARRLNMVGGGTGITPCWQVLEAALRDPEDPTEVALLYANQTEEDILLREELEALAERHPGRFRLHYTVDRAPEGWTHSVGFVSQEMLAAQLHPKEDGTLVLMCGPPPMINFACKPNLEALGFSDSDYVIF